MTLPQCGPPRSKKDYIWTKKDPITLINLSLLGPHKVTIFLKLITVEKFIKKDNTKTLTLLKGKN